MAQPAKALPRAGGTGKTATVRLFWTKSPAADLAKEVINLTIDGAAMDPITFGPEVEEFTMTLGAMQSCTYSITSFDSEGLQSVSEGCSFVIGDLEPPPPATGLGFEIVAVNEPPTAAQPK